MASICVVAHFAYGAMKGGKSGHVGGVEKQTSSLCKWLAARGHRVSILTWNEGGEARLVEELIDGVRVIKMCRRDDGLPGLRFFHPRWTSLNRAMKLADAELYYQNCAEYTTGQVALWCRRHERRFVYSVASDTECDPKLPALPTIRERVLYKYGLRSADRVIAQTRKQQDMLQQDFDLDSVVLPMPCDGPSPEEYSPPIPPGANDCRIAWAARLSREKRPELLLEAAAKLPWASFEIAGGPDQDREYAEGIDSLAKELSNVKMLGRVERERMSSVYENASLFCSTSQYEGFPNTFLEAWSRGLPIVSTVDPDNLISSRNLGVAVADASELVEAIRRLSANPEEWKRLSENVRQYYLENHALESAMSRFENLFVHTVANGR